MSSDLTCRGEARRGTFYQKKKLQGQNFGDFGFHGHVLVAMPECVARLTLLGMLTSTRAWHPTRNPVIACQFGQRRTNSSSSSSSDATFTCCGTTSTAFQP